MNKTFARALIGSVVLAALSGQASASNCYPYMLDLVRYAQSTGPAHIQVSFAVKQGNGLSASSTPWRAYANGPTNVAQLDWDGSAYLTGPGGQFIYSDRFAGGNVGNPYSIQSPEPFDFKVNLDGYVTIYNRTWGVTINVPGQCQNNVLYGWGPAIGLHNGPNLALYVFSFQKIAN